jgi:hypothetical protein
MVFVAMVALLALLSIVAIVLSAEDTWEHRDVRDNPVLWATLSHH